jgi:hypothetical protein
VVETPLARAGLDFVGLDPFGQNVGVDVKQHVEDVQRRPLEAHGKLLPVVLAQDRLHGDQMLTGEPCDLLGEDGDQFPPRREVLEIPELMIFQRPHQQVADLFWIEVPSIGQPPG